MLDCYFLEWEVPFFSGGGVLCFVQGPWKINLVGGLSGEQIWHRVLQWSRLMCEHLPHVWCTKENASTWIMGPCHRQVENCRVSTWPRLKKVPSKNSFHLQHVSPVFDSPFELWGMDTQNEDLEEVTFPFECNYFYVSMGEKTSGCWAGFQDWMKRKRDSNLSFW